MLFGKICVAMFSFISGFGLYFSFRKDPSMQSCVKRAIGIYLDYWCILVFMIPIYVAAGNTIVPQELIASVFAYGHEFNYFNWYVLFYFVSVFALYFINRTVKKLNYYTGMIIMCVVVGFITHKDIFIYFSTILIGYITAKYEIFDATYNKTKLNARGKFFKIFFSMILWMAIFIFRYIGMRFMGNHYLDFIWGTLAVFATAIFIDGIGLHENKIISKISKATGNMWYLHAVFFGSYAVLSQRLAYLPKISVLVVAWTFAILAPLAMAMEILQNKIKTLCFRPLAKKDNYI